MSHKSNYPKRGGQPVSPFSFPYTLYNINSTHPHRGLKPTAIDDPHGIRGGMDVVPAISIYLSKKVPVRRDFFDFL